MVIFILGSTEVHLKVDDATQPTIADAPVIIKSAWYVLLTICRQMQWGKLHTHFNKHFGFYSRSK